MKMQFGRKKDFIKFEFQMRREKFNQNTLQCTIRSAHNLMNFVLKDEDTRKGYKARKSIEVNWVELKLNFINVAKKILFSDLFYFKSSISLERSKERFKRVKNLSFHFDKFIVT